MQLELSNLQFDGEGNGGVLWFTADIRPALTLTAAGKEAVAQIRAEQKAEQRRIRQAQSWRPVLSWV